ncbi:MAG: GGDEF domain-containing protein [Thiohalomonadales bacterium]
MATMTHANKNKVLPVKSAGNLAAQINPLALHYAKEHKAEVLQLSTLLQTTLDTNEILKQFSQQLNKVVSHDCFMFISEAHSTNFLLGKRARHSCTYELNINNEPLGILTLSRASKFSADHLEIIENYICILHYPLRNSLLYQNALSSAHRDALTGIGNRAAMTTTVHREIELAFRHNRSLGVIMLDVDHFKNVNDKYGHQAGDCVLQSLVECTDKTVRITDMLFRYGGEEFVVLMPETNEAGVLRLAKRIRRRIEKLEIVVNDQTIKTTVSLGITNLHETDDEKSLFARADEALYKAKREGRNCIRVIPAVATIS